MRVADAPGGIALRPALLRPLWGWLLGPPHQEGSPSTRPFLFCRPDVRTEGRPERRSALKARIRAALGATAAAVREHADLRPPGRSWGHSGLGVCPGVDLLEVDLWGARPWPGRRRAQPEFRPKMRAIQARMRAILFQVLRHGLSQASRCRRSRAGGSARDLASLRQRESERRNIVEARSVSAYVGVNLRQGALSARPQASTLVGIS